MKKLQHARIAVSSGFNAQFERFEFLLPGNQFIPYDGPQELGVLLASHEAVAWLQAEPTELAPPCIPNCQVLGTRWEIKGRHRSGEITLDNVWYPQSWLFRREWLITNAAGPGAGAAR